MEKIEKEHFRIEIYRARIDHWIVVGMTFLGTVILAYIVYWIIHPGRSMVFVSGVIISVVLYLFLLFIVRAFKRLRIILTRDAFIQTVIEGVIPWEDIDHVEYDPGEYRKGLSIYYTKHDQIKKLGTFYATIEDREQFLESVREFSKLYGFTIREK